MHAELACIGFDNWIVAPNHRARAEFLGDLLRVLDHAGRFGNRGFQGPRVSGDGDLDNERIASIGHSGKNGLGLRVQKTSPLTESRSSATR